MLSSLPPSDYNKTDKTNKTSVRKYDKNGRGYGVFLSSLRS